MVRVHSGLPFFVPLIFLPVISYLCLLFSARFCFVLRQSDSKLLQVMI
jgi:hypothetical protein